MKSSCCALLLATTALVAPTATAINTTAVLDILDLDLDAILDLDTVGADDGVSTSSYDDPLWEPLRDGLDAWQKLNLDVNFAMDIGTAEGRKFLYENKFTLSTPIVGMSLSKWTTAVMMAGLVNDGILSFEDKANKHLKWWATDPLDPRSNVTLMSLLSLTSGFLQDAPSVMACQANKFDYESCAKKAYEDTLEYTTPRTRWTYLSCHHQFAGAMAVAASGKTMHELFETYLFKPYNMTKSLYAPPVYPLMAAGLVTNGNDLQQFLLKMLTHDAVPAHVLNQVEKDWTEPPVNLAPRRNYFGHYGMGHMWECFGYDVSDPHDPNPLPPGCVESKIHSGPGDFGVYPLLDRSKGGGLAGPERPQHYWSLDINENFNDSGIPEYLRIITKPVSDLILNGTDPRTVANHKILRAGGGLLRRDIVYIRSELIQCNCTGAPGVLNEPFASLLEGLPLDEPSVYRGDLLAAGYGKTLFDVIDIQKKLGNCTCAGRPKI